MSKFIRSEYFRMMPFLVTKDADGLRHFIQKVFGMELIECTRDPLGKIVHAGFRLGDAAVEICDSVNGAVPTRGSIHIYVPDCDATYRKAKEYGAKTIYPCMDWYYGERGCAVSDPYGNIWYIATVLPFRHPTPRRSEPVFSDKLLDQIHSSLGTSDPIMSTPPDREPDETVLAAQEQDIRDIEQTMRHLKESLSELSRLKTRITRESLRLSKFVDPEFEIEEIRDRMKNGVMIVDFETGNVVEANPALFKMLDRTPTELIGHGISHLGCCLDSEDLDDIKKELLENGFHFIKAMPFTKPDGKTMLVDVVCTLSTEHGGIAMMCTLRDVTESALSTFYSQSADGK